jgi:hypothetical protein
MSTSLQARAKAAIEVLQREGGDPALMLALVVWPTPELEDITLRPRNVSAEEVERMVALKAEGLNHRQIGKLVGRPRGRR